MDSVTQAVLGASICGSLLGRQYGRKAVLSGAIIATLPDLDVFIRYGDPITSMVSHRGFSHSLFVLSALGILVTILWRLLFPHARASAGRVGLAVWLALITHPLLDAFTSYGTQLLWPLAATPATWSSIFIIDPLYTLPLLIATLIGLARGAAPATLRACNWALLLSSLYLAASVGAKFWAEQQATTQLSAQQVEIKRVYSAAQPLNILLWRVLVRDIQDRECEVIVGLLDRLRAPAGHQYESLCLPLNSDYTQLFPPLKQLEQLRWFSDDWVRYDIIDDLLVVSDVPHEPGPWPIHVPLCRGRAHCRRHLAAHHPVSMGQRSQYGFAQTRPAPYLGACARPCRCKSGPNALGPVSRFRAPAPTFKSWANPAPKAEPRIKRRGA